MHAIQDGPSSSLFKPVPFNSQSRITAFPGSGVSEEMVTTAEQAPAGPCVCWGIPFEIRDLIILSEQAVSIDIQPTTARWLVFMHTSDRRAANPNPAGIIAPMRGDGQLGEHAADYVIRYSDDTEERVPIRRRFQIGAFQRHWGENCFEAVAHQKPRPTLPPHEQPGGGWGWRQTRVDVADSTDWVNWLWAWENPRPEKEISGLRFEPVSGLVVISAISAGDCISQPLRWESRRKACLRTSEGGDFEYHLDEKGLLEGLQLDMGQVISASARLLYPIDRWSESDNNQNPKQSENEVLIEYTAHKEACFHLAGEQRIPVKNLDEGGTDLQPVDAATQRVTLRVVEKGSRKPVPVKLHVHGEWGEYLPPNDRHRIPNPAWFEDYSTDFVHGGDWGGGSLQPHYCTYIPGETELNLPLGNVYIEVSKGFEIRPIRQVVEVAPGQDEIVIELEKVLDWRDRGWVTADTHVHFLSPMTALLEGAAEGVNVINLLASQWGELMTNVGDFDGKTTWGSKQAGGDGEYLVRVGSENRQHVMGHISLLGYSGRMITPMTAGGPDESALGDPIEILLTEWARQCKRQGGLVVLPHFPNPRAEHAASIVSGEIDAIEMTSWGNLYGGIDPYSLSDWYRYLNCGYLLPAVGGTDKMSANTAVGTVRTYARIPENKDFNYDNWMEAVRRAETFVTYGPLLEFSVEGQPMGSQIKMSASGGHVNVEWQVASATIPMSRVELMINGEIRESTAVSTDQDGGSWSVPIKGSCWLALLVRGHYADKTEIITAHSSPVMIRLDESPMLAAADAVTILEQIEGAMAYLDTVGTRAEVNAYKRMRLVLQFAHRSLHNRLHQQGYYHQHSPVTDHPEHSGG